MTAGALAASLCAVVPQVRAQAPLPTPTPTIADCTGISSDADRLACYDRAAGREPSIVEALPLPAPTPARPRAPERRDIAGDGLSGPTQPGTGALGHLRRPAGVTEGAYSLLSRFWELAPEDKRGTFHFIGYRPNYILPVHWTTRINRAPQSPTQTAVEQPNYRRIEAKFQLSLRTKVVQGLIAPHADLWVGFTQQALWQIWNGRDSKPFRNSDYEPEAIYVMPTDASLQKLPPFGWTWRYTQVGIAHQSNGQSDPLSRSWNRVYLGAGFELDDWSLTVRAVQRLNEPLRTDNNPDLIDFRGRLELQLNKVSGLSTASLLLRTNLNDANLGALQFEWTYPVKRDAPDGLRWFVQVFRGYGETLTDYNFRQTSFGAGVTFLQF